MKKPKILSSLLTLGIAASLLCQSTVFAEETGTDAAVTATESGSCIYRRELLYTVRD